jgi:hypothetical protein
MKIIYSKEIETLYLKEVIYTNEKYLGVLVADEEGAMIMADKEAKQILKKLQGGTEYWGSKPPRK